MSALLLSALAAGSSGQGALYVDDVFSTYLYTGNGSTQTINNGIDLAGKGGLVWAKSRSVVRNHLLADTVRGAFSLNSNNTTAQGAANIGFTSTGFNTPAGGDFNISGNEMVSWTFRKAPKFFDAVTYTGNGVAGRQIPHSLGAQAGFVTVKATSATGDWISYHRSATGDLKLNLTDAQTASRAIITAADANTFTVSGAANTNGVSYVAYLWAHDPSADGIIQCGSLTTDASGNATVNLGWEPQFILRKCASASGTWVMVDSARGLTTDGSANAVLAANNSNAEVSAAGEKINSTGFTVAGLTASATFIHLAIRRPNKPPTSGEQVYNAVTYAGNNTPKGSVIPSSFAVDLLINKTKDNDQRSLIQDRLRGSYAGLFPQQTGAEESGLWSTQFYWFSLDEQQGVRVNDGGHDAGYSYINHFFKRAPGFMDVVCDTGTGVSHAIAHNLTKVPELIIRKSRSAATQWEVWHSALAATEKLVLNSNATKVTDATAWNSTLPTATQFTVGAGVNINANAATFVTYLFASLPCISKVGSYTGNGTSQTIDCGFSTGARFFLVKATSTTGSWWVYDSARGIVSAADPALQLNSTAAEITSADAVDPASVGIIVNQEATCSINATGVSYIFLAIA